MTGALSPDDGPAEDDDEPIFLSLVPLVEELEAMVAAGKGWSREYETRVDEVSIALFGITAADTRLPEPDASQFYAPGGRRPDRATYDRACAEWADRDAAMEPIPTGEVSDGEIIDWWLDMGVDVATDAGPPLRCLKDLDRQMLVAIDELVPGAKLTLDGSGKRSGQGVEAWGSAIAAEAASWRSSRDRGGDE